MKFLLFIYMVTCYVLKGQDEDESTQVQLTPELVENLGEILTTKCNQELHGIIEQNGVGQFSPRCMEQFQRGIKKLKIQPVPRGKPPPEEDRNHMDSEFFGDEKPPRSGFSPDEGIFGILKLLGVSSNMGFIGFAVACFAAFVYALVQVYFELQETENEGVSKPKKSSKKKDDRKTK